MSHLIYSYAVCRYAECHYAECSYAEMLSVGVPIVSLKVQFSEAWIIGFKNTPTY
jgi:hypothetical protein